MALLCELPGIIKEIKVKTEALNYGELWVKTHSQKPSPLPTFGESVEEKETLNVKKKRDNVTSSLSNGSLSNKRQSNNGSTPAATLKKTKVIVFELPQEDPVEFLKEPIEDTSVEQSGLSKLIGSSGTMDVDVFIPHFKKSIRIKIPQSATFQQLVLTTIKKKNEGKSQGKLEQDPDAYIVRIANEDGQPDDMFPALAMKGKVERWHNVPFLLIENPNWKPNLSNPIYNNSNKTYLRINLPDGAFHTSLVEKNMKISKILNNICAKRQLVPSDYFLQVANDPDATVYSDTKISDLKDPTLNLVQRTQLNSNDSMYIDNSEVSNIKKKKTQSKNVNN